MSVSRGQLTVFADLQGRERPRRGAHLDEGSVRELAEVSGHPVVTSLYLDIDGRRRPALGECDAALESLFRKARRLAERLGPPVTALVDEDLAAVEAWIASGVDRSRTKGLGLFSCSADGFLQVFALPVPVRDDVVVGARPDVGQLEEILARSESLLVVLTDSQQARFFEARLGTVKEVVAIFDPLERQVDTDVELGSWEHRHEEEVRRHLRRVAGEVTRRLDAATLHGLVVGGPTPAAGELVALLPARAAGMLVGRVSLPIRAQELELQQALADLEDDLEAAREARLSEELRARVGVGRGAAGLQDSLAAINDKGVQTLVLARGFSAAGARCPSCGRLSVGTGDCPVCGRPTETVEDVIDAALDQALAQHARVEFLPAPQLEDFGNIAVIERHR